MQRLFFIVIAGILMSGCASEKKKQELERVSNIAYTTITDSIYSSMPGKITALNGRVYWHDVTEADNFIHVVDASSGKEVYSFGNMGDGPNDFAMPIPSVSTEGFYLSDLQKGIEHLFVFGEDGACHVDRGSLEKNSEVTRMLHVGKSTIIALTPGAENLFKVSCNGTTQAGGKFPLSEKVGNAFYLYQGNMDYNANRNRLVYSSMSFPYLATYSLDGCKLSLDKELPEKIDYTVQDGNLVTAKDSKRGAMELALTKNHIVTLDRDVVVEGDGHAVVGIALDEGLVDVLDHLIVVVAHHGGDFRAGLLESLAVLIVVALKDLFAGALEDLFGNFSAYCVQHNHKSPLYTPDALARSMVRFAPS